MRAVRRLNFLIAIAVPAMLVGAPPLLAQTVPRGAAPVIATLQGSVTGSEQVPATILAADFVTPQRGYLALAVPVARQTGARPGRLLTTTNGGATWQMLPYRGALSAVHFVGLSTGYALTSGGTLLETADGGRQWRRIHLFAGLHSPANDALSFPDAAHGWVETGRALYRTMNRGTTWTRLPFRCPGTALIGGMVGVSFVNDRLGFLLCNSGNGPSRISLFRTVNGGQHWVPVSVVDAMSHIGGTLDFLSPRFGIVTAGFGTLTETADGGRTFQPVPGTPFESVLGMSWVTARAGYAYLSTALERTTDGGGHWQQVYPAPRPLGFVAFASARDGIGVATAWNGGSVLETDDGGAHWQETTSLPNTTINDLLRGPNGGWWAVATVSDPQTGIQETAVLKSSTGTTWQTIRTLPESGITLSFASKSIAYLADGFGNLFRSTDGGRTWMRLPNTRALDDIRFVSPETAWAIGPGRGYLPPVMKPGLRSVPRRHVSVLYRTTDAGRTWREVPIDIPRLLPLDVTFLNPLDGWVPATQCSAPGRCSSVLLRTSDGGHGWQVIRLGRFFIPQLDVVTPSLMLIDDNGLLYRSLDGGVHWQSLG